VFTKSAAFYDAIYSWKDYQAESEKVRGLIESHSRRPVETLLDVACGTGAHMAHLKKHYLIEGLDLDPGMLAIARKRHPEVTLHEGDMTSFDLGKEFDALVCLFGSIGYLKFPERLGLAVRNFARHLRPGGVVLVEPWLTPDGYKPGSLHSLFVNEPDLRIARMNIARTEEGAAIFDWRYLVATPTDIKYFTERHELGLFTRAECTSALQNAGFNVEYDDHGFTGRGLYIAVKQS
jgi:ubiquinone/menaquinone biosynthesis C-methylase UbiE